MENQHNGHRQRLKNRWLDAGDKAFSPHEKLELLLSYAIPRQDTKPLAKQLLHRFGSISNVLQSPVESLSSEKGIGVHAALLLNFVGTLGAEIQSEPIIGKTISSAREVADYYLKSLGPHPSEQFHIILLNQRNKIIHAKLIEHGIENRAQIYIKKIVASCFDRNATALICVHNHPSHHLQFSKADLSLSQKLQSVLQPVEVRFLDHLLIAGKDFLSMRETNPEVFT